MYVRIGTFKVDPSRMEDVVEHFRTRAVAAFRAHEGFLGYQAFVRRDQGLMVGISRWTTRAALEASADSARRILEQASELGATSVGEPRILDEAFDAS